MLKNDEILMLTTNQLVELSEAFNRMQEQVSGEDLRGHLFRLSAKMFAYADRRRRANMNQAHAFELSLRQARALKSGNGAI